MIIGLIIIVFAALALLGFIAMSSAKPKTSVKTNFNPTLVQSRWSELKSGPDSPTGLKNKLIEADNLLDYVLKGRGYAGDTMAERLKKAQTNLPNREAVWKAHKLRNAVVHEVGYEIVPAQINQAVSSLGEAIKSLGVSL